MGSQILEFSGGREKMRFNLAIDGPAGAGKVQSAKRCGKGAFRLSTLIQNNVPCHGHLFFGSWHCTGRAGKIEAACKECENFHFLRKRRQQVYLNGVNVTGRLRTGEAGKMASATSAYLEVTKKLVELQQEMAENTDLVMDGRDIGTAVLPNAPLKVYLTASAHVRALRRWKELTERDRQSILRKSRKISMSVIIRTCTEHSPLGTGRRRRTR